MRSTLLALTIAAALVAAPAIAFAHDGCCDPPCCDMPCCTEGAECTMPCCAGDAACDMPCCADEAPAAMPCCEHGPDPAEPNAIDVLIAMDRTAILPPATARQTAVVWFHDPVWVGRDVFMGKYIIEHDTDRQARGEPCTHIYSAHDPTRLVAAFHCVHIDGTRVDRATVVLRPRGDGQQTFVQFQFAGETAAHGYPTDH